MLTIHWKIEMNRSHLYLKLSWFFVCTFEIVDNVVMECFDFSDSDSNNNKSITTITLFFKQRIINVQCDTKSKTYGCSSTKIDTTINTVLFIFFAPHIPTFCQFQHFGTKKNELLLFVYRSLVNIGQYIFSPSFL